MRCFSLLVDGFCCSGQLEKASGQQGHVKTTAARLVSLFEGNKELI